MTDGSDPFDVLGLPADTTPDEVRAARRRLAKGAHPDAGGDHARMQSINAAAAEALRRLRRADAEPSSAAPSTDGERRDAPAPGPYGASGSRADVPSFTIELLPAEAFEALLLAASELGEVAEDDPPYELVALLGPPVACWCVLTIVPDAGASTVSIAIAAAEGAPVPAIEAVRDRWIAALNALDPASLS